MIYKLVASVLSLVRVIYLPNPFQSMEYGFLINIFADIILHPIAFGVCGLYYRRGSYPMIGSALYTFFYAIHIGLLCLMAYLNWNKIWIVVIIVSYIIIHSLALKLKDKIVCY